MTTQNYVRQQPRLLINRPGRIRVENGPEEKTQVVDLSESGARLFCAQPLEMGAQVELRFTLNAGTKIDCVTYGQVRHYSRHQESHIVGVQFTHLMPEAEAAI